MAKAFNAAIYTTAVATISLLIENFSRELVIYSLINSSNLIKSSISSTSNPRSFNSFNLNLS